MGNFFKINTFDLSFNKSVIEITFKLTVNNNINLSIKSIDVIDINILYIFTIV